MNGNNVRNGNNKTTENNGNLKLDSSAIMLADNHQKTVNPLIPISNFEQPVILQQSPIWSRAIVWGIIGITTGLVLWSCLAKIEEAIPSQGQLEPVGTVKEVQAPANGVVKSVAIKDGDKVKEGDILLNMEPTVPLAQLNSLTNIRKALMEETQFYRTQMSQSNAVSMTTAEIANLKLKPELVSLTKSRATLVAENQLYRTELNGLTKGVNLNSEQQQRLQSSLAELNSRVSAAKSVVAQAQKQIMENRAKRLGNQQLLMTGKKIIQDIQYGANSKISQLERQMKQNRVKHSSTQAILKINQGIFDDIKPVADAGGLGRVQLLKQQEEVTTRQSEVNELEQEYLRLQFQKSEILANSQVELSKQKQEMSSRISEIQQLDQEYERLKLAVNEAKEKLINTAALSTKDLLAKIADNDKRIAEIDSQLTKAIVENEKRVSEIDSQISQAKQTLQYQDVKSPAKGTVFELKAAPGFVASVANSTQPLLKIVPDDNMVAKVYITNKDIGFVKEGMNVDVRIDSFPFSEFGDIKGKLTWIGSDALPPDQIHQFYRFPAKITLEKQSLNINGRKVILQSGMSITANIKIRDRTIMSIFTDLFTRKVDELKYVR